MRLTLRQLHIFVAVADAGSTTAAAPRLALSQSATSGALNELEGLLGIQLFDRVGKRLRLNESGRALLPHARAVLDGARQIEDRFAVHAAGHGGAMPIRLRVGASTTVGNYVLPALVASHLRERPLTSIDVTIGNTSEVAAAVARLEVDLGLIEGPCHEPDLLAQPWLEDELVVVCAPGHPLLREGLSARIDLPALRAQRWLLREPGSGTREVVDAALLPYLNEWSHAMQPGSTEAIKQAACEGLGLACLSACAVADLLALGRLLRLNTALPRLTRRFYLVRHRQKRFSESLLDFAAHCGARFNP